MFRSITFLLLGMMLMAVAFAALPSQVSSSCIAASQGDDGNMVVYDVDGIRYHIMNEDEMLSMRERVGVRQDGVDYNILVDGYGTGFAPPTEEEWQEMVGRAGIAEEHESDILSLPATYDISSQSYFPIVGNQRSQGSCGAWASIYYAYGYLEAKDNGWTDAKAGTNPAHLMSPAWAYNKVNGGSDSGSWMSWNFQIAMDWGVASMATHPYNEYDSLSWGGPAAFREAPLHRAASYVYHDLIGDEAVNQVKAMIAEDRPITFAMNAGYYTFDNGQYIVTSVEYDGSKTLNHAQTVVGYDDTITEDGEIGAFRIVNSWGSGWGNGGYYWLTYAAFKEICAHPYQSLTEVLDRADYMPSLLATWHFNDAPTRQAFSMNLGAYPSSTKEVSPYFVSDVSHDFPSFMCMDISDFRSDFDSGASRFWIDLQHGSGTLDSIKLESYEGAYLPGAPTQVSAQSADVPKSIPCHPTVIFSKYAGISSATALDYPGVSVTSSGQALWTAAPHTSIAGGSCMQSGDVGDGFYSSFQTTVTSATGVSFYWKVSSEGGKDCLRFYVDGVQRENVSGVLDWTKKSYSFGAGLHVLKWNYTRDSLNCGNADTAWVDKVVIIPQDDSYEENDNYAQASTLSPSGTYGGLVGIDDDWYRLRVEIDDKMTVRLDLNSSLGDLDLHLYGIDGISLIDSSVTSGDFEEVELMAPISGDYLLKVQPDLGQFSRYSLTFNYETGAMDYGKNSSLVIISGTDGFASIMPSKSLSLVAGSEVSGSIVLRATVTWQLSETVPLIVTNNWGAASSSFSEGYGNLPNGVTDLEVDVSTTAPLVPGTYYLIFACRNESSAGHVASATDDVLGAAVWGDGNDIASLSAVQINESRATGRTLGDWLRVDGMHSVRIPSDALLLRVEPPDTSPPATSSILTGTPGSSGWYRSAVTVSLTATDAGSGVASTHYRVDGGAWTEYVGPFQITGQGTLKIDFYSTDNQGNSEGAKSATIKIDQNPPTTSSTLSGISGGLGWFTSDIVLNLTASDSTSGLQSTFYRIDSGTWFRYLPGASISTEGMHQVDYYSTDIAGNSEPTERVSAAIDRSAPVSNAILSGAEGTEGWYLGTVSVRIEANDTLSGSAKHYYNLDSNGWQLYTAPFDVTSSGPHSLEYNSSDFAGNIESAREITFRIDLEPPTAIVNLVGTTGQAGWYLSSVDVGINASDDISGLLSIEYSLDGGAWQNYTSGFTISTPGEHTLIYRCMDVAGNSNEQQLSLLVDDSLPTSEIESSGAVGDNDWYVSDVEVAPNGSDLGSGIASFHCRVDGGFWSNLSGNLILTEDGEHVIEVYATDNAGNLGLITSRIIRIDQGKPSSSLAIIGTEGKEGWFVSKVGLELSATDSISGMDSIFYSISGGPWSLYTEKITIEEEGMYEVSYHSKDIAGNVENDSSMKVMIELSPPISSLGLQGVEGKAGWYVSAMLGDLSASDSLSGVLRTLYRLDDSDWQEVQGPIEIDEGQHDVYYYSLDRAGNQEMMQSREVWIDTISPKTINATQGQMGADGWFVSQMTISLFPEDHGSGMDRTLYQLDGGAWTNYSMPIAISEEGVHSLRYYSVDLAGNEELPIDLIAMLDLMAPRTSIVLEGAQGTNDWYVSTVNFSLSSQDGISGSLITSWRLDGGAWTTYDGRSSVETMGGHALEYRTQDRAGNWEEPRRTAFKIDLDSPTLRLNSSGKPFTSKDLTLNFDAEDNVSAISMVKVRLDGESAFIITQSPWDLDTKGLSDGWHDLEVTVYDEAGNDLNQTIRFKVDTNPLSPEGPYGPWLLITIAALAIAAVLIVVMIRKRKK